MDLNHRRILQDNLYVLVDATKKDINNVVNEFRRSSVINDFMVNKINKHASDEDKARELWLMLPKRGPEAFQKIQDILRGTGHGEFLNRVLSSAKKSRGGVENLGYEDETVRYPMYTMPRGYVLIVNVYSDISKREKPREGSEIDVENLKNLYERLGHDVSIISQPTKQELTGGITKFLASKRTKVHCCTIFVMSHGNSDENDPEIVNITTHDDKKVSSQWIIDQLKTSEAPLFCGVPKVLVFVTCRGQLPHLPVAIPQADFQSKINSMPDTDSVAQNWPLLSDVLVVYSTSQGYLSYRDEFGAWLIQELVDVMNKRAKDTDLLTMLEEVDRQILTRGHQHRLFQISSVSKIGFNRKLYFNPPDTFHSNGAIVNGKL